MKRYILSICIIASALSMLAQKPTSRTFASPNGVLKVQIDTNEGKLHYSVYEGTQHRRGWKESIYHLHTEVIQRAL